MMVYANRIKIVCLLLRSTVNRYEFLLLLSSAQSHGRTSTEGTKMNGSPARAAAPDDRIPFSVFRELRARIRTENGWMRELDGR